MTSNEFAHALFEGIEALQPVFDTAGGIKADMERRGWSPTVAEMIAHQWLANMLDQMWRMAR